MESGLIVVCPSPRTGLQRLQEFYATAAQTLDTGDPDAVDRINQWVSSTTRGWTEALLRREDLASGIGCILTNAIYFKGLWSAPSAPDATRAMSFELPDGRHKNAPMMHQPGAGSEYPHLDSREPSVLLRHSRYGQRCVAVSGPHCRTRVAICQVLRGRSETQAPALCQPRYSREGQVHHRRADISQDSLWEYIA